ncbi:COMPASS component SWD2 [Nematocida ausubeli]|nr:COMPASS component SWD2 [Nematocida ausubeli]
MHSAKGPELISYLTEEMEGTIQDSAYSPNGEILACALDSGHLVFHDAVRNKRYSSVETPNEKSFLVDFIDHNTLVHTVEKDMRVLNLERGECTALFAAHTSQVYSISTSLMFRNTISVAHNEAYIWDAREKNPHAKIPVQGRPLIKYSPDGRVFMALFEERKEMCLFDVRSYMGGPYKAKRIEIEGYSDVHFSPDGFGFALVQKDGFRIADGLSGDITMHLPSENSTAGCFSQDSRSFIYATGPNEISMATIPETKGAPIFTHSSDCPITALHYNPCFEQVAVIHGQLTFLQNST